MIFIERLLVQIIQNDPKTAISFHSKRPKFMKKDSQKSITVSRVGPRWPTLDKKFALNSRTIYYLNFNFIISLPFSQFSFHLLLWIKICLPFHECSIIQTKYYSPPGKDNTSSTQLTCTYCNCKYP